MTTVKQVVPFDLNKMGTAPGWCEKNVREGYGLPARLPDAKADMEFNKNNGLLHDMDTLPMQGVVPVFVDTPSVNEHIEVSIDGVLYSDGKRVTNPDAQKYFGWGESCATFRVVEIVAEPEPEPTPEPVDEIKVGDIVDLIEPFGYTGIPLIEELCHNCVVTQIVGDRVVVNSVDGDVLDAVNINNLKKV